METYEKWLKAFRLKMAVFVILLIMCSFVLENETIDAYVWLIALVVTLGTINTMLTNDYVDREHDKLKGKTFASENEHVLFSVVVILWAIIIMLSLVVMFYSRYQGGILLVCAYVGIMYSFTRKFPMLSAFSVAFASALITLLPLAKSGMSVVLFSSTFLFIFAREIVKDVDDKKIDGRIDKKGNVYKKTLPVILKAETALIIAGFVLTSGFICSRFLIPFTGKFCVIWIPLISLAILIFIFKPKKYAIGAKYLDIGILLILFSILYPRILNLYQEFLSQIAYLFGLINYYFPGK